MTTETMKRLERGINHASVVLGKYNHDTEYPNPAPRLGATKQGKHTSQTFHRLTSPKLRPYACQLKPAEFLLIPPLSHHLSNPTMVPEGTDTSNLH